MKQLKMLLLTGILTLFTTYAHAAPVNMAPIISYLLSDTATPISPFANFENKTFYIVDNGSIIQWTVNADVTAANVVIDGVYVGDDILFKVNDRLYLDSPDSGAYFMIADTTADYYLVDLYFGDQVETTYLFFFTLNAAETYLYSVAPEVLPMTTDMLSGKVFYTDGVDNFEEISFISSSEVIFREILIDQNGDIIFDTGANVYPYTINSSGEVVITFNDGGTNTYGLLSMTDTQWNMVKNGDANSPYSTWLLSPPSSFPTSTPTPTLNELLAGNTLYGENNYDAWTFDETLTSISVIDVGAGLGSTPEIIPISVDGNIITFDSGSIEALYQETNIKLTWISGPEIGMVDNLWFDLATLESILGIGDPLTALETFVSGKSFDIGDAMILTFGTDYSFADNDGCIGTWDALTDNFLEVTGGCSFEITFNGELVDGVPVTIDVTDEIPTFTFNTTFTEVQ